MLSLKSLKPNPNYVPGGVENFWLTEKKDQVKVGEERGPGFARFSSSYETEKTGREDTVSQRPETEAFGGTIRGSFAHYET